MLDVEAGKFEVSKATALPWPTILRALDAFDPADLEAAFVAAAERLAKLARRAPRSRAENIALDQLDSALGCLLGENGLLVRAGRMLWLLMVAEKVDAAVRHRTRELDATILLLAAAAAPLGEKEEPAPAARRLARLLASLSRLRRRGWLQDRLFPRDRLESVREELSRLLDEGGGAAGEKLAEALAGGPPQAGRRADTMEGWLRIAIWMTARRLAEGCLAELRRLAAWVRDSLAVASGPAAG